MSFVGLLAAGIVLTVSTCLNVWQRSVDSAELNQEARAIVELLSRDISGAYLGLQKNAGYFLGLPSESDDPPVDRLVLSTDSSGPSRVALLPEELRASWTAETHPPVTDYVVAAYEWLPATSERPEGLYRTTRLVPRRLSETAIRSTDEFAAPELISDSLVGLNLIYFDGTQWVNSWETNEEAPRLPLAVSIALMLRDERGSDHVYRTTVPIRTR